MISFLYWNLNRKDLSDHVVRLTQKHESDIVVLLESGINPASLLKRLNATTGGDDYHYIPGLSESQSRFAVFSKFSKEWLALIHEENRMMIFNLALPERMEFNFAIVHLRDKGHASAEHQMFQSGECARTIAEKELTHNRSVVIGDFNMNPFDPGMICAGGFNAVMDSAVATSGTRLVEEKEFRFFYNPLWSRFGDFEKRVSGTYYYNSSDHKNYYWNIFDQILVRPNLISYLKSEDLDILTHDGIVSLLTKNRLPDKKHISDHLPLSFKLNI